MVSCTYPALVLDFFQLVNSKDCVADSHFTREALDDGTVEIRKVVSDGFNLPGSATTYPCTAGKSEALNVLYHITDLKRNQLGFIKVAVIYDCGFAIVKTNFGFGFGNLPQDFDQGTVVLKPSNILIKKN